MSETISLKQPRINHPQNSPIAPNQKEHYKRNYQTHRVLINPLQPDSIASFDDHEGENSFKKIRLRNEKGAPTFGIPHLSPPSEIKISEASNLMLSKSLEIDSSKPKPLDETNQSPLKFSDSDLEKAIHAGMEAQRVSSNETMHHTFSEIRHKQHHQKLLHQERDTIMKEVEERGLTSDALGWVQMTSTIALVGIAIVSFALALFTGGMSLVLGALSGIAGGVSGSVSAGKGILDANTHEKRGLATGLIENSKVEHGKVTDLLQYNQTTAAKYHDRVKEEANIKANCASIKFF